MNIDVVQGLLLFYLGIVVGTVFTIVVVVGG